MEWCRADCACKPGGCRRFEGDENSPNPGSGEISQPHLPPRGQAVLQQVGDGERKTLFIWLRLCQQEGGAQGGLVLRAGLQLAPRDGGEAAGCIPRREEAKQARDQHLHPGSDGATPALPESPKAGRK